MNTREKLSEQVNTINFINNSLYFKSNDIFYIIYNKANSLIESKLIPRINSLDNLNNLLSLKNSYTQEENLSSSKSNKEMLLSEIKSIQISLLLSNESNTRKAKINNFKKSLYDFKQNLIQALILKKAKELYLQKKINDIKKKIQNKLYDSNKQKKNKEKSKKESKEKNYEIDELSELKMLNFKAENEITKLNFMIQNEAYIANYVQMINIYPEDKNEIFYNSQKLNSKVIDDAFQSKKNEEKETLIQMIKLKSEQYNYITKIKLAINIIKKFIQSKKLSFENKTINNSSQLDKNFIYKRMECINNNSFFY